MDIKEEKFEKIADKLREKAVDKGRKEAEKIFNKVINPAFRSLKLDPFDIKPVLNPIDFLVFNGMNKKDDINKIIFLSKDRLRLVGIWHRCSLLADATLPQGFYLANTPTVYVLLGSQMSQESRPASYVPWIWAFTSATP